MCDFLKDVVYLDRELRKKTQGEEDEIKEQLAQEKEIELGYSPHHYQDVRKLSSL
jgi:hypothetical protein